MKQLCFSLLLLSLFTSSCAKNKTSSVVVDAKQPQFSIKLPGNPTTGYQWTVKQYDKTVVQLLSSEYVPSKPALVGSGGITVFSFTLLPRASYPSSVPIQFQYARPWDAKSAQLKSVTIDIKN